MPDNGGLGDLMGVYENIINPSFQNGSWQYPKYQSFTTKGLDLQTLQKYLDMANQGATSSLWGNMTRTAGMASQAGAGQAMSQGYNPAIWARHASNQAYQAYADQFGDQNKSYFDALKGLPQQAFQSQLSANAQNFQMLMSLLGSKGSIAAGRTDAGGAGSWLPGLIAGGAQVGAAYLGKP